MYFRALIFLHFPGLALNAFYVYAYVRASGEHSLFYHSYITDLSNTPARVVPYLSLHF